MCTYLEGVCPKSFGRAFLRSSKVSMRIKYFRGFSNYFVGIRKWIKIALNDWCMSWLTVTELSEIFFLFRKFHEKIIYILICQSLPLGLQELENTDIRQGLKNLRENEESHLGIVVINLKFLFPSFCDHFALKFGNPHSFCV